MRRWINGILIATCLLQALALPRHLVEHAFSVGGAVDAPCETCRVYSHQAAEAVPVLASLLRPDVISVNRLTPPARVCARGFAHADARAPPFSA
ncbi:MAG: hypothetical protein AB7P04_01680 [Bacteriovoracia bacterium]